MQASSQLVTQLEQLLITVLAHYQITAQANSTHRGVYVQQEKIASIGLRIKKCSTYHGFALNVDLPLSPFEKIRPCGRTQTMTKISNFRKTTMTQAYSICTDQISSSWQQTHDVILNPLHTI